MKQKYLLAILALFISSISFSQKNDIDQLKKQIWNNRDANKLEELKVPEKWNNESAVYLSKSLHYTYNRPHNSIEFTKIIHNRVILMDQASVSEFSEFKYSKDEEYVSYGLSKVTNTINLGVKVIKPDGSEIIIDTDDILEDETEKKVAIPNLEKGDIIDYFFHTNIILGENDLYHYQPVELIIADNYSILNYDFTLETEKDFFITFNTYNGAPKLIKTSKSEKKNDIRKYNFNSSEIDKIDSRRWFYPYVELPSYKFQVNFARTGKYEKQAYAFIPNESNIIKSKLEKEDIFNFYEDKFKPYGKLSEVNRFLKDKTFTNNEEKVEAAFYYIRHAYFTNYIEAFIVSDAEIINPFEYYGNKPIVFNNDIDFIKFFAAFLKDQKIDYEILIGTKRYNGDINNLLLESNVSFLMKVITDTPLYIESFNQFATVNLIDHLLENTNAYSLKVSNQKNIEDIQTIKIPGTTYKENNVSKEIDITIAEDFSNLKVTRNSSFLGQNKVLEQKDRLYFYDYIYEDYTKYGTKSLSDKIKRKKEKFTNEFDALISKYKEKQNKDFQEQTNNEYDFEIDEYSYEIIENGRFGKSESLKIKENFNISDDLIKKAGNNKIIEVGKLIGQQVELDEEEEIRLNNIYMSFPRSLNETINISIPEGYTVSGIDKLNVNVTNETGGFISEASINDSVLKISTYKYYSNNFEPKENWPLMVSFLDAAYQFTQEKILLKKA